MPPELLASPKVNWRTAQPTQFESLWSVMHKFCWLNFVGGQAVVRHFCADGQRAAVTRNPTPRCTPTWIDDLRFRGNLDLARLSQSLGIEDSWCSASTLDDVGSRHAMRQRASAFLRFCPTCIGLGFHSVLFQLTDEKHCPIHGDLLEDSCPKCGRAILYSLPAATSRPYACACGRLLWWNIRDDEWKIPFTEASIEKLGRHFERRLPKSKKREGDGGSVLLWLHDQAPSLKTWRRAFDPAPQVPVAQSVIRRRWDRKPETRSRSPLVARTLYGMAPSDDSEFRTKVYELFRRIERTIFKRMPSARRKRWLVRTKTVRAFGEIGKINWSRDFMAYLVWKSYWFDSCWASFPRGREMEKSVMYKPEMSKVYWRFRQHARQLRPSGDFTSADEWAQLHYFALVLFATWRAARELVDSVKLARYPFRRNRCQRLEKAAVPFVMLAETLGVPHGFELRVVRREEVPKRPSPWSDDFELSRGDAPAQ